MSVARALAGARVSMRGPPRPRWQLIPSRLRPGIYMTHSPTPESSCLNTSMEVVEMVCCTCCLAALVWGGSTNVFVLAT